MCTYSASAIALSSASFVPNPTYSGAPKPVLDKVQFLPFTSDSAEYNVLKTGSTVDVGFIPSQDLPAKPSDADVPSTSPLGSGYHLAPNYLWSVNYFDALAGPGGATTLTVTPAQYKADGPGSITDLLRRYSRLDLRLYYSGETTTYSIEQIPSGGQRGE